MSLHDHVHSNLLSCGGMMSLDSPWSKLLSHAIGATILRRSITSPIMVLTIPRIYLELALPHLVHQSNDDVFDHSRPRCHSRIPCPTLISGIPLSLCRAQGGDTSDVLACHVPSKRQAPNVRETSRPHLRTAYYFFGDSYICRV